MEVYQLEESEEEVSVLVGVGSPKKSGTQQGVQLLSELLAAPGVRAATSCESRKGE